MLKQDDKRSRGLTTTNGVTAALRSMYRQYKTGGISGNEAKTHTMILKTLYGLMVADQELGEFAERLAAIEEQMNNEH